MRTLAHALLPLGLLSTALFAPGCTAPEAVGFNSQGETRLVASDFPEAVLLDMTDANGTLYGCSGALIAPKVVLTAGHCITGLVRWAVTAPNAVNAGVEVDSGVAEVFDYVEATQGVVNPTKHDVGLIFLPDAIELITYPTLTQVEARDQQEVVTLGRRTMIGGETSYDELFVTDPFAVTDGAAAGYPFDYSSIREIDHGDSGGPVIASASSPHLILAVNSGFKSDDSQYARIDDVYAWIHEAIEAHGGTGSHASAGGGATTESDSGAASGDDASDVPQG